MKKILTYIFFFFTLMGLPVDANAVAIPAFPFCENPQGVVKVNNPSGTHGIAGRANEYRGSDTVYTLTPDTLQQCFCSQDQNGIQTNWWRVTSLSQTEIDVLKRDGWVYIPNGALWGLQNTPYLAKNSDYACGSAPRVGGAYAENVLGLATTGNMPLIILLGSLGFLSILFALLLRKKGAK